MYDKFRLRQIASIKFLMSGCNFQTGVLWKYQNDLSIRFILEKG